MSVAKKFSVDEQGIDFGINRKNSIKKSWNVLPESVDNIKLSPRSIQITLNSQVLLLEARFFVS